MANLTKDRNTRRGGGDNRNLPVKASTILYAGAVIELDSTGHCIQATAATGKNYVGVNSDRTVDNSGGADGDETVQVTRGEWGFDNSAGGEALTVADIGSTCYLVDDHTVGKTDAGGTLSALGTVFDVRDGQVYVTIE